MQLNVEEVGPLERKLSIDIPTADVDRAFDAFYRDLRKTAHLKGFRKGKVPRPILEKHYGEAARGEVLQSLVRETLFAAIEEADLDIISEPRLEPEEPPSQGAAYTYAATVEVRPEIELVKVEGLDVEPAELPEPDEDPVERYLQQLRESQAQTAEEEEGVAAANGHVAVIDFEGRIDDEVFDGGTGTEVAFELGEGRAIPGFEEALVGLHVGEDKTFDVDFPEDYGAEDVAGKTATFAVTLRELKRKELPELDDELAKDVSDFDTLDELKADVSRRVEEGRQQERDRIERERVIEALIESNPFPLPPSLVDRQLGALVDRAMAQLGGQLPEEQRQELADRWYDEWHDRAERDTALAFLVPRVAEAHDIEVGDADVDAHLAEVAEQQGSSAAQVKRMYQEQGALPGLQASLLEERVVEFLISRANLAKT